MSGVTIDVHGPLDRAKDVSSTAEAPFERLREECVRLAYADDVPLLGDQRAPAVAGATACRGTSPATDATDRPRPTFFRQPAKATGFPWTKVPFTVATTGA